MYVYVCVRASGASEVRKFWHFYILKLLFLSIFCRYNRYFVGTNGMLVGLHVPTNFQIYRQTLTLSKCMCMRASELRKFWRFYILKLLFLSIFCRYSRYVVGTNDMLVGFTCTDKFPNIPTNTNIEQMYVYASELRKFWHFYILNLLFLSIFCRYIRYFVGTNDMLVGSHVPTNFQMYRQKSEKALLGGGGGGSCPPCPPSGYANGDKYVIIWLRMIHFC